jgi:hypothetical protein
VRLHRDHNHLSWVTEARILEAVREAKGEGPHSSSTSQEAGHGRETERVLADMGWLSELPRTHTERCRGSHYRRREGLPVFLRKEGSKPAPNSLPSHVTVRDHFGRPVSPHPSSGEKPRAAEAEASWERG